MQIESAIARSVRGPYRRRSIIEKRAIVEQCLKPGASVAGVELAHGVNANLVRKWIAKYRAGEYGQASVALLPVHVRAAAPLPPRLAQPTAHEGIEIELARARVCIRGRIDVDALRVVLEALAR